MKCHIIRVLLKVLDLPYENLFGIKGRNPNYVSVFNNSESF